MTELSPRLSLVQRIEKIIQTEIEISTARSSGPGGQNVNRTNSAVIIKFNLDESKYLSENEKQRISLKLESKLTKTNELIIRSEESRDQLQNKNNCYGKLKHLILEALFVPKARKKTKPKRSSIEKRLQSKSKRSEVKKLRQEKY